MKYLILYLLCTILIFCAFTSDSPDSFLTSLGYDFSENYEKSTFTVPKEFDMVYNNYNSLQMEAGYDLSAYKGKECIMYTYEIYNHPFGKAFAHIILYKGEIIGGDISSINIDGFMVPLE